jgi:hypothetical protein
MLFTDSMHITAQSLSIIDGEFMQVALAEKIPVDNTEQSVLWHYYLSAGERLLSETQNFSGYLVGVGANSNHAAAVMNILSTAINRPRAFLQQIVISEPEKTLRALERWAKYCVLHDFYRDLTRRMKKGSDRYQDKMLMYKEERDSHWKILQGRGYPVILSPLSCPGAVFTYGSGTWSNANVSAISGGSLAAQTSYDVSITWVSQPTYQSYQNQANCESGGSAIAQLSCAANQVIQISIASLTPPTAQMPIAIGTNQGVYSPCNATAWNIYVGPQGGAKCLQNASPIPIATMTYALPDIPVVNGMVMNEGQSSSYSFTIPDGICWRA